MIIFSPLKTLENNIPNNHGIQIKLGSIGDGNKYVWKKTKWLIVLYSKIAHKLLIVSFNYFVLETDK